MASSATKVMCLLVIFGLAVPSMATTYVVGDLSGWNLGVDLSAWVAGKTFHVGDVLLFNYQPTVHTVTQVNVDGFLNCNASVTLSSDNSGSTSITLGQVGTIYIISTANVDCSSGLKIAITVVA